MRGNILSLILMLVLAVTVHAEVRVTDDSAPDNASKSRESSARSEKDTYIDLNTGKAFRFMYDELNDKFERDDLLAVDLYVNTNTRDSFWLEQAVIVNNALLRDVTGIYKVDPMKVKRDGAGYRVINNKPVNNKVVIAEDKLEKTTKPKEDSVSSM
jgi:hypothetical protein